MLSLEFPTALQKYWCKPKADTCNMQCSVAINGLWLHLLCIWLWTGVPSAMHGNFLMHFLNNFPSLYVEGGKCIMPPNRCVCVFVPFLGSLWSRSILTLSSGISPAWLGHITGESNYCLSRSLPNATFPSFWQPKEIQKQLVMYCACAMRSTEQKGFPFSTDATLCLEKDAEQNCRSAGCWVFLLLAGTAQAGASMALSLSPATS